MHAHFHFTDRANERIDLRAADLSVFVNLFTAHGVLAKFSFVMVLITARGLLRTEK